MTKLKLLLIVPISFLSIQCSDNVEFVGATLTAKDNGNSKAEVDELETYSLNEEKISVVTLRQKTLGENKTKVLFQVADKDGIPQKDITKMDLEIKENGEEVKNYTLSQQTSVDREVDVVFAIDHTGSMGGEIKAVKENVEIFYYGLKQRGVKANFCLVLFKDRITKKCERFVGDDPRTTINENLESFIDEVNAVKVGGGGHLKENIFGAVLTASRDTPWKNDNQKMIITLTDAKSWEAKDHWGRYLEANHSPKYTDVIKSLDQSKAQVFIIGPQAEGYNRGFEWNWGLPKHSGGQWYNMHHLRKKKITLANIFQYIQDHTTTVHQIFYVSQENSGLDPSLPLSKRTIKIKVKKKDHNVLGVSPSSNMPNGAEPLDDSFVIDRNKDIRARSVVAYINGVPASQYGVADRRIYFDEAPPEGAEIFIEFLFKNVKDNIDRTVNLPGKKGQVVREVYATVNGINVDASDYFTTDSKSGNSTFILNESAFEEDDPYEINKLGQIEAQIYYLMQSK